MGGDRRHEDAAGEPWFYRSGRLEIATDIETLQAWVHTGQLSARHQVRKGSLPWLSACRAPGLREIFGVPSSIPPPPDPVAAQAPVVRGPVNRPVTDRPVTNRLITAGVPAPLELPLASPHAGLPHVGAVRRDLAALARPVPEAARQFHLPVGWIVAAVLLLTVVGVTQATLATLNVARADVEQRAEARAARDAAARQRTADALAEQQEHLRRQLEHHNEAPPIRTDLPPVRVVPLR